MCLSGARHGLNRAERLLRGETSSPVVPAIGDRTKQIGHVLAHRLLNEAPPKSRACFFITSPPATSWSRSGERVCRWARFLVLRDAISRGSGSPRIPACPVTALNREAQ